MGEVAKREAPGGAQGRQPAGLPVLEYDGGLVGITLGSSEFYLVAIVTTACEMWKAGVPIVGAQA